MRRAIAALAALTLPLALATQAQAAEKEYVTLNSKGITQALIKKAWGPPWLGKVINPVVEAKETGMKPEECFTRDKTIKGFKSSAYGYSYMEFEQSKEGHYIDFQEHLYQYPDGEQAFDAWTDLVAKAKSCAGTHKHYIRDANGNIVGETKVIITVKEGPVQYGMTSFIINEDVQIIEEMPDGAVYQDSADEISIWSQNGLAIIETELNKFVPKYKKFTFSDAQVSTAITMSLLATQRYHLTALKTV
ncbi:MAG: hypothetical protein ACKOT0_04670 [bacterium]